jgi:alkanesulfonate monooxygenase SsuD/methylene tetrahydromethanopterin reductase-like flavin-dependent oxidoreductase (luciferase family)
MVPLSILELGRVREGSDRRAALDDARAAGAARRGLGYTRFWVAEHHNMPDGHHGRHLARDPAHRRGHQHDPRRRRRDHAPEPRAVRDRRAVRHAGHAVPRPHRPRARPRAGHRPGSRCVRCAATPGAADTFPQDVLELQMFLGPVRPGQRIEAVPGSGTDVPLWILGSSTFGAQLAAELGLPFGFASHFAPAVARRGAARSTASASSPRPSSRSRTRSSASTSSPPRPTPRRAAGDLAADVVRRLRPRRAAALAAADRRHRDVLDPAGEMPRLADARVQRSSVAPHRARRPAGVPSSARGPTS